MNRDPKHPHNHFDESASPKENAQTSPSHKDKPNAPLDKNGSFKSGFVALIGRPNAGKSTLVNALMGRKIAITSNTPQTTRHRFRAVLDSPDYQIVLVDTPGIHKPLDALGEELNRSALKAVEDIDVVAFLVDASKPFGKGDAWVARAAQASGAPVILVISKADLVDEPSIIEQVALAKAVIKVEEVVVLSALENKNLDAFIEAAQAYLPEGPRWFPEGMGVDQPLEVLIAEFIREKVLISTFDEVPHAIGVVVEELEYDPRRNFYAIHAIIYVEQDSQKGIIIGKGGSMIKTIGSKARHDLKELLAANVHLDLRVKVRRGWRRDANTIKRFGYGE